MLSRFAILGAAVLVVCVFSPFLCSNAAEPLPKDHDTFWEYRVFGDRVLLKNPGARVERLPYVYKGHDGLGTAWWDDDVRLTCYDSSNAFLPSVVAEGDYLHIGWADDCRNRLLRVFYKRSTDLGHTWEEDVVLSDTTQEQQHTPPDMTLSTNWLHAVWDDFLKPIWEDGHVYYRRSLDHGETWEEVYYLSSYDHQNRPSISSLGDTVYVVFGRYIDTRDIYQMHFRKSYDEGATWTEDHVITDYGPGLTRGTLRASQEGLHYVLNHKDNFDDPGNPYRSQEIFYIHSPDFGETWTDPIIVSHRDSIHSQWPSMCVDDEGAVHVTWFDYKFSPYSWTGDIFYTKSTDKSTDDGQFWSEIQVLTDTHLTRWSNIIARGNHLYLVFEDERHGSHNNEVYFRHSRDAGESWQAEQRLTNAPKESYTPVITEQGDILYLVWEDHRHDPTNRRSELYFKRGGFEAISIKKRAFAEHALYLSSHPNPFNEKVVIRYRLAGSPRPQRASLKIYNIRGQLVRVLLDGELIPGEYQAVWDGTDSKEMKVSSGVYLCVLQAGESRRAAPLLFLK
ncbi:MAG: exo-alpha-sialidase [Candidatus Zixiibacteriota bacterium]